MRYFKLIISILLCAALLCACNGKQTDTDSEATDSDLPEPSNTLFEDEEIFDEAEPSAASTPIVTTKPFDDTPVIALPSETITDVLANSKAGSFFDNSVFLGDSITVGLSSYVSKKRKSDSDFLGEAQFLARVSYSLHHTLKPDGYHMHPEYDGKLLQPQKSLKAMGAEKVFIMMGVNDAGGNVDVILSNYKQLISNIQSELPSIRIYIMAVFPMTARKESTSRNNEKIASINAKLLAYAVKKNIPFIDINPALLSGADGNKAYYSDDYVHLNSAGYDVWTSELIKMAKLFSLSDGHTGRITNVKEAVNAREKADVDSELITTIPKDALVSIVDKTSSGWFEVIYNGQNVFVYGRYISYSSSKDLVCVVDNVTENANLRSTPSAGSTLVDSVLKNTVLDVVPSYYNKYWYRVVYNGSLCYIYKSLVS